MSRGIDYFLKFIHAFPDVLTLANADESDVLKVWQGLGYYSRARNLHMAAKTIVNQYQGEIPEEYDQLLKLKGIGDYTACAILSIAYNKNYIVTDGNAVRVFSRFFAFREQITQKATNTLKKKASQLLKNTQPSEFNQAIMELGALICKPDNPACSFCPLQISCQAFKSNTQHLYPLKARKTAQRKRYFHYLIIIDDHHRFLICQRLNNDIWRNLWEFPCIETDDEQIPENITLPDTFQFLSGLDLEFQTILQHKHTLTHQLIFASFHFIQSKKNIKPPNSTFRITEITEMNNYPVHNLMRKGLMTLSRHLENTDYN
jgi:A/G-specific adenine glycosylase